MFAYFDQDQVAEHVKEILTEALNVIPIMINMLYDSNTPFSIPVGNGLDGLGKDLLVDQPEDHLDNRFISETVVQQIKAIKARRQLIFVTRNPNIPVLGDALEEGHETLLVYVAHLLLLFGGVLFDVPAIR